MICSLVCAISRGSSTAVIARGSAACRNVLLMAVTDSARAPIGALYVAASKHPRRRCIFEVALYLTTSHGLCAYGRKSQRPILRRHARRARRRGSARREVASRTWKSGRPKKVMVEKRQRSRAQGSDRRKRGRSYILMVTAPARSPSPPPPPPKAPQHASCDVAKQLGSTPVYFFLSSTPDRAARLPRVLATMRRQSLQPAAIVLSIASTYNTTRFVNSSYTIAPELLNQRPRLLVHTVPRDLGPITKYAGVNYLLAHLQPASLARRAIVVVGDDDVFYGSSFIEDFACAVATGPENAVYSVNGAPGAKC